MEKVDKALEPPGVYPIKDDTDNVENVPEMPLIDPLTSKVY